MILLIDNYDSFTYNLVQMLERIGQKVEVFRNDRISISEIKALQPTRLMISPGPGTPDQAGISVQAIREFGPMIPVLGVCLGHQSIAAAFGGKIVRAERIMHGKTSPVFHDGRTIFKCLPNPFDAIRYHSLLVDKDTLPGCFEVSAWTAEGEIMGLRHRIHHIEGVQFHPESILSETGPKLVGQFLTQGGAQND
ncbi:MAG: aminodeoxychorismate/anthranilate synthase component II [Deltaproteobacteria bacterium]|nr:aminodeoxychorismate/anthranilate synthase component II [Deltaproteobacteria bacterium]